MDIEKYIGSGILEQYCLGLTSEEEAREVEQMAEEHPEIRKALHKMCLCIEEYAQSHAIPPPRELKSKVLEKMESAAKEGPSGRYKPMPPGRTRFSPLTAIAAVVTVLLIALAFMFYKNQENSRKELSALSQQVRKLQRDYQSLNASHQSLQTEYTLLKDVSTLHVKMTGSDHAPKASCIMFWNPEHRGAYLNVVDLPPVPKGHQYQVWADVEGHHHNMGLLEMVANPDSEYLHQLPYIENSRGFVITLEKSGGSKHPNVEQLFVAGNL